MAKRRILLAEDYPQDAYMVTRFLRGLGCHAEVYHAKTSAEATDALQSARDAGVPFDGVILDYYLGPAEALPIMMLWRKRRLIDSTLVAVFTGRDLEPSDEHDLEEQGAVYCGDKHAFGESVREMVRIWDQHYGIELCERPG